MPSPSFSVDHPINRRSFVKGATTGAAATLLAAPAFAKSGAASDRVRVAILGCGNQGKTHISELSSLKNVEIAYVCDIDQGRLADAKAMARESTGKAPEAVADLRRALEDDSVDGVIVVLPDHWHTPAALLALEAGKHVYVEKPFSHNIREGQWLLEASQKNHRVVAHGTQARSSAGFHEAMSMLRNGIIGDVLIAKCWNWQRRENIGHASPGAPPKGVDYDTWVGPAEWMPYQSNRFHYTWHWWRNFGCGGMGNDGIHEVDYALWGLGVESDPTTITGLGGKYYFDDDQQYPDTQQVTMEFESAPGQQNRMFIYEQRLWSRSYPFNVDSGAEFIGSQGKMFISKRGKFEVRDDQNKRVVVKLEGSVKSVVAENQQNWLDCIKSGDIPNANPDSANRTARVIHLGNLSTLLGRTLKFDSAKQQITGDPQANEMQGRTYRDGGHWSVPRMS